MDRIENRSEYHDVIANSLASIVRAIAMDDTKIAKRLMLFNIKQAYVMYRMDNVENLADVQKKFEEAQQGNKDKKKAIDYDYVLQQELADMGLEEKQLDNLTMDFLMTKMFTYQTLAGIKPVQSFKNTARVYARSRSELVR